MFSKIRKLLEHKAMKSLVIMGLRGGTMVAKFVLSIFLARYLGLEDLGLYGLLVAGVSVCPVFLKIGLRNIIEREAVGQDIVSLTKNLMHYYVLICSMLVLIILILKAIVFPLIGSTFVPGELFWLVVLLVIGESFIVDLFFLLIIMHKPIVGNILLFLQTALWILLYIPLAFLNQEMQSITSVMIFWLAGNVLSFVFGWKYFWRNLPWSKCIVLGISKDWYASRWRSCKGFYLNDIANAGLQNIDRYLVRIFLGLEITGVYVLFWQMANAVYVLATTGIIQINRPYLIRAWKDENFDRFYFLIKKNFIDTVLVMVSLGILVSIIAPFVLNIVNRPMVYGYMYILWILLLAILFKGGSDMLGHALLAQYRDKILFRSALIHLIITVLLMLVGINLYDIKGFVVSIVISNLCLWVFRLYVMRKYRNV